MKTLILVLSTTVLLAATVAAQTKAPDQTAKDFYKWYLTKLNAERHPIVQNKTRMRAALSNRLARWIYSPAYSEYGADYFIDAQDWDRDWVNGISSSPAVIRGNVSTVKLLFSPKKGSGSPFGKRTMVVRIVKENGVWKIDLVNNRKLAG